MEILSVNLGEADFATPLIGIYTYGGQKWAGTISGNPGVPNGGGNSITGTPVANILVSEVPPTSVGSNRDTGEPDHRDDCGWLLQWFSRDHNQ